MSACHTEKWKKSKLVKPAHRSTADRSKAKPRDFTVQKVTSRVHPLLPSDPVRNSSTAGINDEDDHDGYSGDDEATSALVELD